MFFYFKSLVGLELPIMCTVCSIGQFVLSFLAVYEELAVYSPHQYLEKRPSSSIDRSSNQSCGLVFYEVIERPEVLGSNPKKKQKNIR